MRRTPPSGRDVDAFDRRAAAYDRGRLGKMHQLIVERVVEVALEATPAPARIVDVGCGTGVALSLLAARLPDAMSLLGVDPAPGMIAVARARTTDPRVHVLRAIAEHLPVPPDSVDLVLATTSFDHWTDQDQGLRECAAALSNQGVLVLTDLFSPLLAPTMVLGHRGRVRTVRSVSALLHAGGFTHMTWHPPIQPLIRTVVATAD